MPSELEMIRCSEGMEEEVLALVQDAARWLKGRGLDQWLEFLDATRGRSIIEKRFKEGEVYLARDADGNVGTITLQWEDPFWGPLGKDPSCGYLHSVAVLRRVSGQGIGRELIGWAEANFRGAGKKKMRLDCMAENGKLVHYYETLGFSQLSTQDWNGKGLVLMEKAL